MIHFADRRDAGRHLGAALARMKLADPLVLALPRGGVPVGYEVARAINAPLDLLLVRKIGAPGHPEFGIGALTDGTNPQVVIDEASARMAGADRAYIGKQVERELAEIERRRSTYCSTAPVPTSGRTVIVVDDGIATGGTVRAALQALSGAGARKVILAVPVAPLAALEDLRPLCDEVVCLSSPEPFHAVGTHYRDFTQTRDAEVVELLAAASQAC